MEDGVKAWSDRKQPMTRMRNFIPNIMWVRNAQENGKGATDAIRPVLIVVESESPCTFCPLAIVRVESFFS